MRVSRDVSHVVIILKILCNRYIYIGETAKTTRTPKMRYGGLAAKIGMTT
jgi:hypothetical protein